MLTLSENFRALFYAPFYAAFTTGAYAAEGVDVMLRSSPDPAATAADLLAGRVDAMWGGPLRVILTHAADPAADTVCFCDVVVRDPFFIVGRSARPDFRLADMAGMRFASVAEVPTPWLCLQDDLRLAGLDPAALNRVHGPTMAETADALRDGTLDAAQLFQPYVEELVADGVGQIWYAAATRGLTAYTSLVARRSVIAARQEEFAAMVRGMHRTLRWFAATPADVVAQAVAAFLPDVPLPLLAAAIERYRTLGLYATGPATSHQGYERLQAAMLSGGALQKLVNLSHIVGEVAAI